MSEIHPIPFSKSYWVIPGRLLAGEYPGSQNPDQAAARVQALYECGIRQVINLMEADETNWQGEPFRPYIEEMRAIAAQAGETIGWARHPIRDMHIPDPATMHATLDAIDRALSEGKPVYVHCWGGKGRTGTVVGCYLLRHAIATPDNVLSAIRDLRQAIQPYADSPETEQQRAFVLSWQTLSRRGSI